MRKTTETTRQKLLVASMLVVGLIVGVGALLVSTSGPSDPAATEADDGVSSPDTAPDLDPGNEPTPESSPVDTRGQGGPDDTRATDDPEATRNPGPPVQVAPEGPAEPEVDDPYQRPEDERAPLRPVPAPEDDDHGSVESVPSGRPVPMSPPVEP